MPGSHSAMHTRLPLLQPSMETEVEPAKKLDLCEEAGATPVTTRLTWAAAVAMAEAMLDPRGGARGRGVGSGAM